MSKHTVSDGSIPVPADVRQAGSDAGRAVQPQELRQERRTVQGLGFRV